MKAQLSQFFGRLPLTAYAVVGVLAAFGGWLAIDRAHQRQIGRREVEIVALAHELRVAKMEADSLAKVEKPQAVAAVKGRTKWDSTGLRQLQATLDSLKARGETKPETVTVSVPVAVLATADTAIKSCTTAFQTCEARGNALSRALAASERSNVILKASTDAQRPRLLSRCGAFAGVGGVLAGGRVYGGPTVSVGCRLVP